MGQSASLEVLAKVAALLERAGEGDVVAELHRVAASVKEAELHQQTIREVTRALLENEKTYRLVFSHELDAVSLFDPATGRLLDVNDAWVAMYGWSREEALGMKVTDVSAEPRNTSDAIANVAPGGTTRVDLRWHRAKDGAVFPVELTAGKLTLGGREVMYAVMRDIRHRDDAERALRRSEASFRTLIESMTDGAIVHRYGKIVYMNPAARRLLGYGAEEDIRDKPALEIVHPEDHEKVVGRVVEVITKSSPAPPVEERLLRRDGTTVLAEVAGHLTVFDGEPAVLAIARDVTERKQLEAQLVLQDRLASLGRLSASVGHELNNPLAYVLGNVTLMEREIAKTQDLPEDFVARIGGFLRTVKEGAERMRDIVNDLKTLARGDEEPVVMDVQQILDVCVNMAEPELDRRARLVKDYRDRVFVRGTQSRLGQVFLNLLVNAAESIAPGDPANNEVRITVRTGEGGAVIVEIADTGEGIPPEIRDRIFEPFFTTKRGSGTGLGLSISYGIVTALGGSIRMEPREVRGSVFRVVLPSAG